MIDDTVIELFISETTLTELERRLDGYSDPSEWPFEFYEQLMVVSDQVDEARNRAVAQLGEDEMKRQYYSFCGKLANA